MGADIASLPPVLAAPSVAQAKRGDSTQGDDARVSRARASASNGDAREYHDRENGRQAHGGDYALRGRLRIDQDETSGEFVYRIVDEETGEILRQWPREEALRMNQALNAMRGALLDRRV